MMIPKFFVLSLALCVTGAVLAFTTRRRIGILLAYFFTISGWVVVLWNLSDFLKKIWTSIASYGMIKV